MLKRSLEIKIRLIVPNDTESQEFVESLGEYLHELEEVLAGDIEIIEEIGDLLTIDDYMN